MLHAAVRLPIIDAETDWPLQTFQPGSTYPLRVRVCLFLSPLNQKQHYAPHLGVGKGQSLGT